ncbi:MAG: glycosyltransferase family 2 protein [bacterium]|nr:MAG: glycosyltransferase family 2 protein [bacterium]
MISVIIPTYNEQDVIVKCLESLVRQTVKDFEVIVVDDGSTDETLTKIQSITSTLNYHLEIVNGKHKGAGSARNLGATWARGDILVFVDSDMTFDKHFLKMLVKPILAGKTKGTFSKDEYVSNWDKPLARAYNLNEGWENKKRHPRKYPDTQKVFRAILRAEFNRVGGFTAGGYNDDWSLSEKLGYEATVAPKAIFFHKNPDTLNEIFHHAVWVGKRKYKFGILGYFVGLVRSSLPVSLIIGLVKSFLNSKPSFLIFKVVYDFGVFVGILNYMFTKRGSK